MSRVTVPRPHAELFDKYRLCLVEHTQNRHHKYMLRKRNGTTFKITAPASVSDRRGIKNLEATIRKLSQ